MGSPQQARASLKTRLTFSHLLVALISIILLSAFAGGAIVDAVRAGIRTRLEDLALSTGNALVDPLGQLAAGQTSLEQIEAGLATWLGPLDNLEYTLFQPDGTPLIDSRPPLPNPATRATTPEIFTALDSPGGRGFQERTNRFGQRAQFVAVRIPASGPALAVLRLETPQETALDTSERWLGLLIVAALVVALSVSVSAWLLASNLARPIGLLTQAATRLADGELQERVNPEGPEELQQLAHAFNHMAARLQAQMNELRMFVANASHELRTPLTAVKLRAEALRRGAIEDPEVAGRFLSEMESEVDRLARLVNDLLDLSRIEAGLGSSRHTPVKLDVVATEVYEAFGIRAARAGVTLELDLTPGLLPVLGNEDQLRRVLDNFMDNAIKYTPSGGHVLLLLERGKTPRTVRLVVRDNGQGIPPDHLGHIFERFYRAETTRPRSGPGRGSGLGLAIAKSIVENHNGQIGVESQLGQGSTFWTELPTIEA